MSDKQNRVSETRVQTESLPLEVQRLAEVMQSVDPSWQIETWLVDQANMSLDLVSSDLARERIAVEQRLHRLETIARRLQPEQEQAEDPMQRNLFDCFNLQVDEGLRGLGTRAAEQPAYEPIRRGHDNLMHPAASFLDLLPDDEGDDPLLAVACQMMLVVVDGEIAKGENSATLEAMFKGMNDHGVAPDEIDEAIDHLLAIGALIEIDDDCFIPAA
jgi:hypothetical protein